MLVYGLRLLKWGGLGVDWGDYKDRIIPAAAPGLYLVEIQVVRTECVWYGNIPVFIWYKHWGWWTLWVWWPQIRQTWVMPGTPVGFGKAGERLLSSLGRECLTPAVEVFSPWCSASECVEVMGSSCVVLTWALLLGIELQEGFQQHYSSFAGAFLHWKVNRKPGSLNESVFSFQLKLKKKVLKMQRFFTMRKSLGCALEAMMN